MNEIITSHLMEALNKANDYCISSNTKTIVVLGGELEFLEYDDIEKAKPRHPKMAYKGWHCPRCNHLFWSNEMYGYCPKCGQRLDWSGVDDIR